MEFRRRHAQVVGAARVLQHKRTGVLQKHTEVTAEVIVGDANAQARRSIANVVRRVAEYHVGQRAVENRRVTGRIGRVSTKDSVIAEVPKISTPAYWSAGRFGGGIFIFRGDWRELIEKFVKLRLVEAEALKVHAIVFQRLKLYAQ